jgi:phospholipid/cholesterol/gamma-HCH transport system permease protein
MIQAVQRGVVELGAAVNLGAAVLTRVFSGRFDRRQLLHQLDVVGVRSVPIVALTALFTGAIMVLQAISYVRATGASSFVPNMSAVAVFSELGPALIAIMFSGRVGANTAARLGTMVITDQMDALEALAVDPLAFFVVPRFLAMASMMVLLVAIGNLFALIGSASFAHMLLDIDFWAFLGALPDVGLLDDLSVGLLKAFIYGSIIALVSCSEGLRVQRSAGGVGRAVNRTVVLSALNIYLADYLITWAWYRVVFAPGA